MLKAHWMGSLYWVAIVTRLSAKLIITFVLARGSNPRCLAENQTLYHGTIKDFQPNRVQPVLWWGGRASDFKHPIQGSIPSQEGQWSSSHSAVTQMRNKNRNIQGRSPNVVKAVFHTKRNCFLKESIRSRWEQILSFNRSSILKRDTIEENHCLFQ